MSATLALIGGEEFADGFEDVHAALAAHVRNTQGRPDGMIKVVFLPTCAAHDGPERVRFWCDQARARLGGPDALVACPLIVDRASADDVRNAEELATADWIYIGGGYPHVAMQILSGTRSLAALRAARESAVLISGASAGAMLMCANSWVITPELGEAIERALGGGTDPEQADLPIPPSLECLGFVPNTLCWPHYNVFHSMKMLMNGGAPRGATVIGIEEQTAAISNSAGWHVLGRGRVSVVSPSYEVRHYPTGTEFRLS